MKPLRSSLRLGFFSKRGGATKPSLSLRGAGFRAYEKRTLARVSRGGAVGTAVDAVQQPRPQDDTAVDLLEAHNNALTTRGGQLPLLVLRLVRILPRLLAILVPALGGYSNLEKFDLLGTALFAYVGTIAGGKNGMDVFGCMVIGTVTATGGGLISGSRRVAAVSLHCHESSPGVMDVGGLFFDFGAVRTALTETRRAGGSARWRPRTSSMC